MEYLVQLYSGVIGKTGEPLRPASIRTYIGSINKVFNMALGKPFETPDDITILANHKYITDTINRNPYKHKKALYSAINTLLRQLNDPAYSDAIGVYEDEIRLAGDAITEQRGENKICEAKAQASMPLDEIIYKTRGFNTYQDFKLLQSKLIVAFYVLNIDNWVPRNNLYTLIILPFNGIDNGINNYIRLNKKAQPVKIIINTSKTSNATGAQEFKISQELKELLIAYMRSANKLGDEYLFTKKNGQPYDSPSMSVMVSNAFVDVVGKRINVDLIRCIIVSEMTKKRLTLNQRKKLAKALQHSVMLQLEYDRHNLV